MVDLEREFYHSIFLKREKKEDIVKRRIQYYAGIKMKNTNIYLDWNCMMDDDVEEVGAKLPVEVLMKSSFPRRRRQGDCCSCCCCLYRLHRHRRRCSFCGYRCRDEARYDKGFRSNGCDYGRSVDKQFETTTMTTASLTTAHDSPRETF